MIKWISRRIRWSLFNCSCSDESEFKTGLETISLMIKLAERTSSELKFLRIHDEIISGNSQMVATYRYLIKNISFDFTNKTIDYYSLLRTFNEIRILVKSDSSSNGPSLRLSQRYSLLWFYLRHIYYKNCNAIFGIHHHHKPFIIYLVMEFWGYYGFGISELYPRILIFKFEKLFQNGSPQLEPILELFRGYDLEENRNRLGVSKKISNYIDLARSITKSSEKNPNTIWNVRALAELEAYLIQQGRKVDHSTFD